MKAPYSQMNTFRQPAMGSTNLGPLLVVIVAMEIVFASGPVIVYLMLPEAWGAVFQQGDTAIGVIAQLFSFGLYIIALTTLVQHLHGRGFWSMVGPLDHTLWTLKKAGIGVGILMIIQAFLPPTIDWDAVETIRPLLPWLMWMPVTIVALLIQTGAEELYFRGYLQQQLAAMSEKRMVWMGIPSVLFGAGHYLNGFGPADGLLYAIWAACLGFACADLTARTGNIGAAVGLHLSNNLAAFTISGVAGWPSSGLALVLYPFEDPYFYDYSLQTLFAPWAIFELIIIVLSVWVMWLAARVAIRQ